ncbi:hypothetical protein HQ496_13420 [bacterium]|nr:hypothetical protein [bacterium]
MLHPDVLKWASHCGFPIESVPSSFEWEPSTLKQIGTQALRLGKVSSHLVPVMNALAATELRLKNLRNGLGISRSHPESGLLRATVLVPSYQYGANAHVPSRIEWTSLGRWISDLLDRAAGFDPIHAGDKSDRVVTAEELATYSLDHVIVLDLQTELHAEMGRLKSEALNELAGLGLTVHESRIPHSWVSSGPDVFNAVFEAAFFIHGYGEVS